MVEHDRPSRVYLHFTIEWVLSGKDLSNKDGPSSTKNKKKSSKIRRRVQDF